MKLQRCQSIRYLDRGIRLKELDSFNPGSRQMHKAPVMKILLKQQNERKNGRDCSEKERVPFFNLYQWTIPVSEYRERKRHEYICI